MTQSSCLTILLIDDRTAEWMNFRQYLQQDSIYTYKILQFETGKQAIVWCQQESADVILLNFLLPDGNGLELLGKLRESCSNRQTAIILLTEHEDIEIAVRAMKNGAQDCLIKNQLTPATLHAAIHDALKHRHRIWQLEQSRSQQQLIAAIALRIRQSLKLQDILAVTTEEVRKFLQVDRVIVYKFNSDMSGTVVSESVLAGWKVSLATQIQDTCFQRGTGVEYRQGKTRAIDNIYEAGLTDCHLQLLEQFEVKANLVVPILVRNRLWGLLIAHQCHATRQWDALELELLDQLAVQIAIAIQQASAYEIAQTQMEERKRTEKTLRESVERFRSTFEQAAVGISHILLSGQFLRVNQRFCEITGYRQSELMNLTFQEITHPDDLVADLQQLQMLLSGTIDTYSMDKRYIRKDRSIIWIKLTVSLVHDTLHHPQYLISVIEDISQRKQAEIALLASEARFQAFMNYSPTASWITDGEGRIVYVSQTYLHTFQLPANTVEDVIGKTVFDLYPVEIAQQFFDNIRLVAQTQQVLETVEKAPRIYSTIGDFLVYKFPLPDTSGQYLIGGVAVDITERILAEQALLQLNQELEQRVEIRTAALQESERRYAALTEAAPVAIFRVNNAGDCIYANDYWTHLAGRGAKAALGKGWVEILHPDDRDRIVRQWGEWYQSYQPGQIYINEGRFLHPDGNITWFYCQILAETDEDDKITGYIGTLTDITERQQAEAKLHQINEELTQANIELARATRLKDEFLANMSHELRTPLNAILGMSEAFHEGVLGEINHQQATAIATIERSGRHLLELIDDILDLAKIESGKLELQLSDSSIKSLCHSSLLFVQQLALNKNIRLMTDIAESLGSIQADERRLRQVLINLLSNAIKFTPAGGVVTLKVYLDAAEGENSPSSVPQVNFTVSDTGIGIASEDIHKLFQPFIQLDSNLNRHYNGTGLGLALVQRITTLHGGTVSVTSQVGEGSCFTVRIPYVSSDRNSPTMQEVQSPSSGISSAIAVIPNTSALILLVEDNQANITTMANYLQHRGYRLAIANNGRQAIEQIYTQHPHLILMDIQMPEMDGLQAIQRIREDVQFNHVPIIALTALAMPGDRETCLAAGANEYLTKPVRLRHLIATIQQLLT
ncbi:two-component hybrid sensor and regulator [Calothrix brevissima NIES-22]|nr:two-component hybrid sensor and regulator [Calothrix brevissima NIES-22]